MTTIDEALALALRLSPKERVQLIERVASSLEDALDTTSENQEHWGRKLSALLDEMDTTDWDALDIDDPVAWVKAQREQDLARLDDYWNTSRG